MAARLEPPGILTMLWVIFAAMTLASLALLLWPLLKSNVSMPARGEHDLAVYRQQLDEIDIELERGVLNQNDAAAARLEIERRMLKVGEELSARRQSRTRWRTATAVVVGVLVPAASLAFYLWTGHPELPAQLFSQRRAGTEVAADKAQAGQIADMVERLRQKLQAAPGDPQGWKLLGRSYLVMGRFTDAVDAYRKATELAPNDTDALMSYGETQVFAAQDDVTPSAEAVFRKILTLDPKHPGARYYLALQRAQAGDMKGALDGWLALYADSAADAPWQAALQQQLQRAAAALKIDLASVLPKPLPPVAAAAPPGPSASDVAAASQLPADQQSQMIRGMVQRLADRLQQNPDDFDGWMRLGRAYQVLGEADKSRDAYDHAAKLKPEDPAPKQALAALAAPAGSTPPPVVAPPPGPNASDMAAAQDMTPEQRGQMVQGMVQRLADRLQQNPDDFDGWMRLGRAYQVMNQPVKAGDAYRHAAKLKPADPGPSQALAALGGGNAAPTAPTVPAPAVSPPAMPKDAAGQGEMIRGMVQKLAERLQQHPDDFAGWTQLGRSYSVLGDKAKAVEAYDKAAALRPKDADALLNQADAIQAAEGNGSSLTPKAEALYRQVLAMQPDNPDALWYVGIAERQAGRPQVAALHWERLLGKLDPKSGEYQQVSRSLAALKQAN